MKREKEIKKSGLQLKKLASAKGKLTGAFYFAANASGEDSMVVIRVVLTEAQLGEVTKIGKKFRAQISGAKFASGLVSVEKSKMFFDVETGTVPLAIIKKSFREYLCTEDSLALLKKVRIRKAGASTDESTVSSDEVERVDASERETAETLDISSQREPDPFTREIARLLKEDAARDFAKEIRQEKKRLRKLEAEVLKNPSDEGYQRLQQERVAFAQSMAVGPDPFDGASLPSELFSSVQVAALAAVESFQQLFTDTTNEQIRIADEILALSNEEQFERYAELMPRYEFLNDASLRYQAAIEALYAQIPVR